MESKTPSVYTTLVLVTDQFECERIIKAGRVIADLSKTSYAVPVSYTHLDVYKRQQ